MDGQSLDYFYGQQCEQFAFFRIPKVLVKDTEFRKLSSDAKILYGLMLDRMELSARNNWFDEDNRVFVYYTSDAIAEDIGCCVRSAKTLISELKKVGLIEVKLQGQGKPAKIYVMNFVIPAPLDVQNPAPLDVQNPAPLDVQNLHPNNTEYNNTELNNKLTIKSNCICSARDNSQSCEVKSSPEPQSISKPTFEEVKQYVIEKDLVVNPRVFYDFFENTGWKHSRGKYAGKPVMNWKNTLLCWHNRDVKEINEKIGHISIGQLRKMSKLTPEEENRLYALKKTLRLFDEIEEAEEYNDLKRQIEELERKAV